MSKIPNPLSCGCGAKGTPFLDPIGTGGYEYKDIHVVLCPLHAAAPDLLEALKLFMDMWNSGDSGSSSKRAQQRRADMWDKANAAIAKAASKEQG